MTRDGISEGPLSVVTTDDIGDDPLSAMARDGISEGVGDGISDDPLSAMTIGISDGRHQGPPSPRLLHKRIRVDLHLPWTISDDPAAISDGPTRDADE